MHVTFFENSLWLYSFQIWKKFFKKEILNFKIFPSPLFPSLPTNYLDFLFCISLFVHGSFWANPTTLNKDGATVGLTYLAKVHG